MLKTKVCSKCEYLIFNFLISYFCFRHTIILTYMGDDEEDIGTYEEENVLDNLHFVKNCKNLRRVQLYHLKINCDVKAVCPNAKVFID